VSVAGRTVSAVNTDDIEIGVEDPAEVIARVNAALSVDVLPDASGDYWSQVLDAERRMAIAVAKTPLPVGVAGPISWDVELRGVFIPLEDERDLALRRWAVGYLWDALAVDTNWHMIWWSDDDPGDGIIRERLPSNGCYRIPSLNEQMAESDRYLAEQRATRNG
jgi:hypothetical protein